MNIFKLLITSIFVFFSFIGSSKTNIDAKILMKGSTDTLELKIRFWTNPFYHDIIDELSLKGTLVVYINGEKQDIKESQIDYLSFTDPKGKFREFVCDNYTGKLKSQGVLFEKMYVGKISWYRDYQIINYVTAPIDYFVSYKSASLGNNNKRSLIFRTQDRPDLKKKIKKMKTEEDIMEILKLYDM
jgi:hypothetical protein